MVDWGLGMAHKSGSIHFQLKQLIENYQKLMSEVEFFNNTTLYSVYCKAVTISISVAFMADNEVAGKRD